MPMDDAITSNAEIARALRMGGLDTTADGLPMLCLAHDIEVPGGVLRAYEHVSRGAWAREPRRAVLLVPDAVATSAFFRIPVAGFDAATDLLIAGSLCLTVDLLGSGASTRPADGRDATLAAQVSAIGAAIRRYRSVRGVSRVDVIGEGWGGAIASQLAALSDDVGAAVMVSTVYRTALDGASRDPDRARTLAALQDGYVRVGEPIRGPLSTRLPGPVARWTIAHQAGWFPVAPMIAMLELPYFDPSVARVPGLVIRGAEDERQSHDDALDLAASYGSTGASLITLEGAGRAPRVEAARDAFWSSVLRFLS